MGCWKTNIATLLVAMMSIATLALCAGCTGTSSVQSAQGSGDEPSSPSQPSALSSEAPASSAAASGASAGDAASSDASASDASASSAAAINASASAAVSSAASSDKSQASSASAEATSVVDDIEIKDIADFVLAYNEISKSPIERTWKTGRASYAGESYGYILNISDMSSQTCVRIGNNTEFSGMIDPFADVVKAFGEGEIDEARDLFNQAMDLFDISKEDVAGNVGNLKVTFSIMNEVERGHIQIYHFK